jgi:hypothetical protein
MTEWGVVGVLVVLVGLVAALVKPLIRWNTSLVENTMALKAQTKTIQDNETRNEKEHGEIWNELDEHDKRISNIEKGGAG